MKEIDLGHRGFNTEEARSELFSEIEAAKDSGVCALKIIHGYGSGGHGGGVRSAVRSTLASMRRNGRIRCVIFGERWLGHDDVPQILDSCPKFQRDKQLMRQDPGVTIVLLA